MQAWRVTRSPRPKGRRSSPRHAHGRPIDFAGGRILSRRQIEAFKYSNAMLVNGLTGDEAALGDYLRSPKKTLQGTKMTFAGLMKDDGVQTVVAHRAGFSAERTAN